MDTTFGPDGHAGDVTGTPERAVSNTHHIGRNRHGQQLFAVQKGVVCHVAEGVARDEDACRRAAVSAPIAHSYRR